MPGPLPKAFGIPEGCKAYICADCGKRRWYHPSVVKHMAKPYRCNSCSRKHRRQARPAGEDSSTGGP